LFLSAMPSGTTDKTLFIKISILQKITPHNKAEVLDILLIEIQINEGVHMGMFQERKEWICDGSLYGRKQ